MTKQEKIKQLKQKLQAQKKANKQSNAQGYGNLGINANTGKIKPKPAIETVTGAVADDTNANFNMQNPGLQTDAFGNSQTITRDPVTGQTSINQTGGAGLSAVNTAFTGAASDFGANGQNARLQAQDANYSYITKNYGAQKAQEQEAAKQELAQRGIPIDPDPNSLYGRTLQQIDQKYQSLDDQAKNQSILSGNQTYATNAGVIGTLGGAAQGQSPTFTAFQGGVANQGGTLADLLKTISGADLAKYGIDQDTMTKLKGIAASKSNAALAAKASGGGGGDTGPIIGGSAP